MDAYLSRTLLRRLLGAYLCVHFAMLLPWCVELFSREGMLGDARLSPLAWAFPNPLSWLDTPAFVVAFVALGFVAALCLTRGGESAGADRRASGRRARWAAFVAWFVLACLFGRNPLIRNPSLPFVGFLLLAEAFGGDRLYRQRVLWVVLSLGYAYSGITKLAAPSWLDGSAVQAILANPLARPTVLRDMLLGLPSWMLAAASYFTLVLEIGFPLLALSPRGRKWGWLAMSGLQLSLLVLIDFADLTFGMLLFHLYLFEPAWFRRRGDTRQPHAVHEAHGQSRARDGALAST